MSDVFSKAKRSVVMSRIRGAGNMDTELRLIVLMRAAGIAGWRRGARLRFVARRRKADGGGWTPDSGTAGIGADQRRLAFPAKTARRRAAALQVNIRPDFVFPKQRLAVFVDGCFWHGCPRHATWPKNRAAFWLAKLSGNKARDRLHNRLLRKNSWRVLRIWEHALTTKNATRTLARLQRVLGLNQE